MGLSRRRDAGVRDRLIGRARRMLSRAVERVLHEVDTLGERRDARRSNGSSSAAPQRTRVVSPAPEAAPVSASERTDSSPAPNRAEVILEAISSRVLSLRWAVGEEALDRARGLLDSEGELQVCLVVVSAAADGEILRDERKRPAERRGTWKVEDLPEGAQVTASVGLAAGERYVSVAHAPVFSWPASSDAD